MSSPTRDIDLLDTIPKERAAAGCFLAVPDIRLKSPGVGHMTSCGRL